MSELYKNFPASIDSLPTTSNSLEAMHKKLQPVMHLRHIIAGYRNNISVPADSNVCTALPSPAIATGTVELINALIKMCFSICLFDLLCM